MVPITLLKKVKKVKKKKKSPLCALIKPRIITIVIFIFFI